MRLIDADALSETMRDRYDMLVKDYGEHDAYAQGYDEAITLIEVTDTVDAQEVKRGKWVFAGVKRDGLGLFCFSTYKCSMCGRTSRNEDEYCSHCGAKMGGYK